jgi:hypothetical protein
MQKQIQPRPPEGDRYKVNGGKSNTNSNATTQTAA